MMMSTMSSSMSSHSPTPKTKQHQQTQQQQSCNDNDHQYHQYFFQTKQKRRQKKKSIRHHHRIATQARLRMQYMMTNNNTNSIDYKILVAFSAMLIIYSIVTLETYLLIESNNNSSHNINDHSILSSSSSNNPNNDKHKQQQQQQQQESSSSNHHNRADTDEYSNNITTTLQQQQKLLFPIHAANDLEEIDHPGILLMGIHGWKNKQLNTIQKIKNQVLLDNYDNSNSDNSNSINNNINNNNNNKSTSTKFKMNVPKFWRPKVKVAYGSNNQQGGIREYLGNHGQRLITQSEANHIGSFIDGGIDSDGNQIRRLETIYVSIASYRDPECQLTVEDLYDRADHPERIRVAIIDQLAEIDDQDQGVPPCNQPIVPCNIEPNQSLCKYSHLIDRFCVPAILSVGPVFARHLAHRMYRGEYFAMQIDSHVRFIQGWDTSIVQQWVSAENEMAILTVYLSDLNGSIDPITHNSKHPSRPIMCNTIYEEEGEYRHLRHDQQPERLPDIHGEPTLEPFWAAGFSFARGHFIIQVPYDQYLPMVFQGEEISIGLRAFTYGYDFYAPETSVAFHMYAKHKNKSKRKKIKKFWENENLYSGSDIEGYKRLNGIIGMSNIPNETYYQKDEIDYGLGHVRSTDKFFQLYGINTQNKTVEGHLCKFVGKSMHTMFITALRKNRMGLDLNKINFEWKDPNPRNHKKQNNSEGEGTSSEDYDYDYETEEEEEEESNENEKDNSKKENIDVDEEEEKEDDGEVVEDEEEIREFLEGEDDYYGSEEEEQEI